MTQIRLNCLILGDGDLFLIRISSDANLADLREAIKNKNMVLLQNVDERNIQLFKATTAATGDDLVIQFNNDKSSVGQMMTGIGQISDYFDPLEPDFARRIHVLVATPQRTHISSGRQNGGSPSGKNSRKPPPLHPTDIPRNQLVNTLYLKLKRYGLVQVRGTSASGKSTLASLLHRFVRKTEPELPIYRIYAWPEKDDPRAWSIILENSGWEGLEDDECLFIIDEAQMTYWDLLFWNGFLKTINSHSKIRVVLFASYGSPSTPSTDTSVIISENQKITLRHMDHGDGTGKVGLLFTREECQELVDKRESNNFDSGFVDGLYDLTTGHAGALSDLLDIVARHESYSKMDASTPYTWRDFRETFSQGSLFKALDQTPIFKRGLPRNLNILQNPAFAFVFRKVLALQAVEESIFSRQDQCDALDACFRNGWLHADITPSNKMAFSFASPLHRWVIEYYLGTFVIDLRIIQDKTLLDFVLSIIREFKPQQFSIPRSGPTVLQRPTEAQYQDEFYRCFHLCTESSLVTFPEDRNASGRVDFFIPHKNWGVELLRDGHDLDQHTGRFSTGDSYQSNFVLEDYIILDFRRNMLRKRHDGLKNLYHVVFRDDYAYVQVLNNHLEMVKDFTLFIGY